MAFAEESLMSQHRGKWCQLISERSDLINLHRCHSPSGSREFPVFCNEVQEFGPQALPISFWQGHDVDRVKMLHQLVICRLWKPLDEIDQFAEPDTICLGS